MLPCCPHMWVILFVRIDVASFATLHYTTVRRLHHYETLQ